MNPSIRTRTPKRRQDAAARCHLGHFLFFLAILILSPSAWAQINFDLRLDPGVAAPNEQVMVELTISNQGTAPVSGLSINMTFPAGINTLNEQVLSGPFNAGASCAVGPFDQGVCTAGEPMVWSLAGLNPGEARVSTFPVTVAAGTATGTTINWSATVSDDNGDITSDAVDLLVDSNSELTLTIDEDKDPVAAGDTLTYTLHYGNRSNSNLSSGQLSLTLPTNVSFVSASDGGILSGGQVVWPLGTVAAASVGQRKVEVTVNAANDNGALVTANSMLTGTLNFLPASTNSDATTYVGNPSPLALSLDVNPTSALPGEQVLVSLKLANASNLPIVGSQIQLRFPQHVASVTEEIILGEDAGASCAIGAFDGGLCQTNEFLFFNVAAINPGKALEFTLPATVVGGTADLIRWDARVRDGDGREGWTSVTLPVDDNTVMSLAIDQDKDPVLPGDTLIYTVHYGNTSMANVTNGTLSFTLPPNTSFVSATGDGAVSGRQVTWSLGTIPAELVTQQKVEVLVSPGVGMGALLPARADFAGTASFLPTVQRAARTAYVGDGGPLQLSVDINPMPAKPGEQVMLSLKLGNTSNLPVLGSQVLLRFPERVAATDEAIILGESSGASCAVGAFNQDICTTNEYLIFNTDALNPGRAKEFSVPITLQGGATSADLIDFSARIVDGDGTESWEKVTLPVDASSVLTLAIDQDQDPVSAGDRLTYTIHYGNTSTGNVTNTNLTFKLPPNTTFVSATGGGSSSGNQVSWSLGTFAAEVVGQRMVVVDVDSTALNGSLIPAQAEIAGTANFLPTVQRAARAAYVGDAGPLSLSLDINPKPALPGEQVMVSMKFGNESNLPALGSQVLLRFPALLNSTAEATILGENAGASCAVGAFNQDICSTNEFVFFTVDAIDPGRAVQFTLPATVVANAGAGDMIDWAVRIIDGDGIESWEKSTLVVDTNTVMSLAIDQAHDPVASGSTQTYIIRYGNTSSGNVLDAQLSLTLPPNASFVSATGGGTASGNTVTWPIGTLPGSTIGQRAVEVLVSDTELNGALVPVSAELIGTQNFAPSVRRASTAAGVSAGGPLEFDLSISPVTSLPGSMVNVMMTVSNASDLPVLGSQVAMQFPTRINSLAESAITGGLDAAASCAIGAFNQSTCSTNEFMIWNFAQINPGETLALALPPTVAAAVQVGSLIPWSARLLDEAGAESWRTVALPIGTDPVGDLDGDGVGDSFDNCLLDANADQRDSDGDGYGNRCDADFNNDCAVNATDLGAMRLAFFSNEEDLDLNGDGIVNITDLGLLRGLFFAPPGPSAVSATCN